jgi:FKBP-type peptidyl-prolyl cis-trans isomerase (trigger factor)
VENQIIEALLKDAKVTVPASVLQKQLAHRMAELIERMKKQGVSEEDIKKREEGIRKELEKSVERDVKIYFILDKIGQLESVTAAENENLIAKVMELLMKEAVWES